ncbi:MAG: T9SS type A sorting domain-containing protein [Cytophagaceae bacterium]|nr:MAG: T9SS type A sorting domain-containing protein [Cytophagaceae bacterium]
MNKITTLALATTLATAALSAQAQITLDGVITAAEIGTGGNKYQSLGAFSTAHNPATGPMGFGNAGLLRLYGANSTTKLYIGIAGSIEVGSKNNFQLYMDLPNKTGVPVGTGLPTIASSATAFGTFPAGTIGGTKLDLEADAAIAVNGQADVMGAVYTSATTAVAKSLGGGATILTDGTPNQVYGTTGDYALFANTRLAYKASLTGISANPGNTNSGGAGSYALEYEFDRTALGLPAGASIVRVFAAYVSGDAYWSSDIIPQTTGGTQGTTTTGGLNNIGFSPDFTNTTLFPGLQAAAVNVVVLSSRQADETAVAMSVFPNPSEGASTITYQVQGAAEAVAVRVTDLLGREVRTLLDATQTAGFHDLSVATGDLSRGTYLVQVQVGDKVATRRLAVTH